MVEDLSVTETDRVKYDKIAKAKDFENRVNKAIDIIPEIEEKFNKLNKEICEGEDCLKNRVDRKFQEIDSKVEDIQSNFQYVRCENCGYEKVQPLSSFCPQCGFQIDEWSDPETGLPVKNWEPYWKTHPIER